MILEVVLKWAWPGEVIQHILWSAHHPGSAAEGQNGSQGKRLQGGHVEETDLRAAGFGSSPQEQ